MMVLNVIVLYVCPSEFLSQRSVIDMLKKELNFSQLREVHHFIVLIPCLYILLTCWVFFFAPQHFIPSFDTVIL